MALGVTFAPGSQDPMRPQPQQPLQEAIKLLSLRLPQVVGANSPIPAPLLQGQGSMGQADPTGNPLLDLLRRLMSGMGQQPDMMGMPGPPMGPGRTGGGVPNPEPGPLPLPQQQPRVILQPPAPKPAPGPTPYPPQRDPDIDDRQPPPMY